MPLWAMLDGISTPSLVMMPGRKMAKEKTAKVCDIKAQKANGHDLSSNVGKIDC